MSKLINKLQRCKNKKAYTDFFKFLKRSEGPIDEELQDLLNALITQYCTSSLESIRSIVYTMMQWLVTRADCTSTACDSPFFCAIEQGEPILADLFLQKDVRYFLSLTDDDGISALNKGVASAKQGMRRLFFKHALAIKIDGKDVLDSAIEKGNTALIATILAENAKHRWFDLATSAYMGRAAFCGDPAIIKQLLDAGASQLDVFDPGGFAPLHHAALHGHTDACRILLARGANPNLLGRLKQTPLHMAIVNGQVECARLLAQRSDLTIKNLQGKTATVLARECGIQLVLNTQNKRLQLHNALVLRNRQGVFNLLIWDRKNNGNLKLSEGKYMLSAINETSDELVRILVNSGACVDPVGNDQLTPLLRAAKLGYKDCAVYLAAHGADFARTDPEGRNAFHLAVARGHTACAEALQKYVLASDQTEKIYEEDLLDPNTSPSSPLIDALKNAKTIKDFKNLQKLITSSPIPTGKISDIVLITLIVSQNSGFQIKTKKTILNCICFLIQNGQFKEHIGYLPFFTAIELGNDQIVEWFLKKDPSYFLGAIVPQEGLPIVQAVSHGHEAIVKLLLDYGSKYEQGGRLAFCLAAQKRLLDLLVPMIEAWPTADWNETDDNGETPLFFAGSAGAVAACRKLLALGVDPTICNKANVNVLTMAVVHKEILELVFEARPSIPVDTPNSHGVTAWMFAVIRGAFDSADFLFSKGADPQHANNQKLKVAFIVVNSRSDQYAKPTSVLNYLKANQHILDWNEEIDQGRSLLAIAAGNKRTEVVEYLLSVGGDPTLRTKEGFSPLSIAVCAGNIHMVRVFLNSPYKEKLVDLPDVQGHTPLMKALYEGYDEVAILLLKAGANPVRNVPHVENALSIAQRLERTKVVKAMFEENEHRKWFSVLDLREETHSDQTESGQVASQAVEECGKWLKQLQACKVLADYDRFKRELKASFKIDREKTTKEVTNIYRGKGHVLSQLVMHYVRLISPDQLSPQARKIQKAIFSIIQLLCKKEVDITISDPLYATPLHMAALYGVEAIVKLFIDTVGREKAKDFVNQTDLKGGTPLLYAAQGHHAVTAGYLLDAGADHRRGLVEGVGAVNVAAAFCAEKVLDAIKARRDDVDWNEKSPINGNFPLFCAAEAGAEAAYMKLIHFGADPTAVNNDGDGVLHIAAARGRMAILRLALESSKRQSRRFKERVRQLKQQIDLRNKSQQTPLHYAIYHSAVEAALYLIRMGADVLAPDDKGRPLLHLAAKYIKTDDELVKILQQACNYNKDVHKAPDPFGNTPLVYVLAMGWIRAAEFVFAHDPDVINTKNGREEGLVFAAVVASDPVKSLHWLKEKGYTDWDGQEANGHVTAMFRAIELGKTKAAEALLGLGADPRMANDKGQTAIDVARDKGFIALAEKMEMTRPVADPQASSNDHPPPSGGATSGDGSSPTDTDPAATSTTNSDTEKSEAMTDEVASEKTNPSEATPVAELKACVQKFRSIWDENTGKDEKASRRDAYLEKLEPWDFAACREAAYASNSPAMVRFFLEYNLEKNINYLKQRKQQKLLRKLCKDESTINFLLDYLVQHEMDPTKLWGRIVSAVSKKEPLHGGFITLVLRKIQSTSSVTLWKYLTSHIDLKTLIKTNRSSLINLCGLHEIAVAVFVFADQFNDPRLCAAVLSKMPQPYEVLVSISEEGRKIVLYQIDDKILREHLYRAAITKADHDVAMKLLDMASFEDSEIDVLTTASEVREKGQRAILRHALNQASEIQLLALLTRLDLLTPQTVKKYLSKKHNPKARGKLNTAILRAIKAKTLSACLEKKHLDPYLATLSEDEKMDIVCCAISEPEQGVLDHLATLGYYNETTLLSYAERIVGSADQALAVKILACAEALNAKDVIATFLTPSALKIESIAEAIVAMGLRTQNFALLMQATAIHTTIPKRAFAQLHDVDLQTIRAYFIASMEAAFESCNVKAMEALWQSSPELLKNQFLFTLAPEWLHDALRCSQDPLYYGDRESYWALVKSLLSFGTDPNHYVGDVTLVHVFAEYDLSGTSINTLAQASTVLFDFTRTRRDNDHTPLMCAVLSLGDRYFTYLVNRHPAQVNLVCRQGDLSALHLAAGKKKNGKVIALLKAEANVHALDTEGQTALHHAAKVGNAGVVKHLKQYHAKLNQPRAKDGATALHIAAEAGQEVMVHTLLEEDAKLTRRLDGQWPQDLTTKETIIARLKNPGRGGQLRLSTFPRQFFGNPTAGQQPLEQKEQAVYPAATTTHVNGAV